MMAVAANGVCRRYGRRWALAEVSFEVPQRALVMVTGRNGSGKSTLLRVLASAIRTHRGTVHILGQDVQEDRERVRHQIAHLGHQTYLYGPLTGLENLAVFARFIKTDSARPRLLERLDEVGLADRGDDAVSTYSAGMRQRLALARVLQQDAQVVLLDEPYGHLDPAGFIFVDRLLEQLRARGSTVLMATHLLSRGRALCDHALLLEAGRLAFFGPAAEMPGTASAEGACFMEGA